MTINMQNNKNSYREMEKTEEKQPQSNTKRSQIDKKGTNNDYRRI